jgi:hypothetical protein
MVALPKEHGAYGQLTLPLVTALAAAGVSAGGLLLTVGAAAAFVAHEPAAILLGQRGVRARREHRGTALRFLWACAAIAAVAGAAAFLAMDREHRWSLAVPLLPAVLLAIATARDREKSWYGELAAALAFAGAAVPVSMAAGASLAAAAAVAIPFALMFMTSTLAVRTVILRVRAGGNERATATTRRGVFALTGAAATILVWLAAEEILSAATLVSASPGLFASCAISAYPPPPARLRVVGWTLVAVSVLTAVLVIGTV